MFFFFFFSSRRRHTRFDCDWSSDVCSSDIAMRLRRVVPDRSKGWKRAAVMSVISVWGRRQRRDAHRMELTCRSEEHTSELQSQSNLVCRLLLEKKKIKCRDEDGGYSAASN